MWQWSRVSPEVFYIRHFPTCSTVQHPSCRVAQGLLTHALPSDKPRQLPSESFSNVYIQFSVHIRSTVKSAYISACESAHVSACMQFFTCCDPVWNVLITSLQTFSALINTRSSWRFQLCLKRLPYLISVPCMKLEEMQVWSFIHKTALFVSITVINKMRLLFTDFPGFDHMHEHRVGAYQTFRNSSRRTELYLLHHPLFSITSSLYL